jgi:hypothetical protein
MDPEAFEFVLLCSLIRKVDKGNNLTGRVPFKLYARITCLNCEAVVRTYDGGSIKKAIGIS